MSWLDLTCAGKSRCVFAVLLACGPVATSLSQSRQESAQGANSHLYVSAPSPAPTQSEIILFRPPSTSAITKTLPAHIYLDGEFQAALMPNGFARFCVAAGKHTVESYLDDSPTYSGKTRPAAPVDFQGGDTYFAGVVESEGGRSRRYQRADAEALLAGAHEQRHVISRASAVVPCEPAPVTAPITASRPPLIGLEVRFAFARSDAKDIEPQGRDALREFAARLASDPSGVGQVLVRGHADEIGTESLNRRLSAARARTVRQLLVKAGVSDRLITTVGVGSTEPVTACPHQSARASRIECNAPNRRVEVRIAGSR